MVYPCEGDHGRMSGRDIVKDEGTREEREESITLFHAWNLTACIGEWGGGGPCVKDFDRRGAEKVEKRKKEGRGA